jgi:hypothetical protein
MGSTSIGTFFTENSRLFTVLGVFGAISVYFSQLQLTSRWRRLGIVASITIFILVAIVIQRNIPPQESDQAPFDFIINVKRQKFGLIIFYVAFWVLILSITSIVIQYSGTALFLVQFLFFIIGIGIVRVFISRLDDDTLEGLRFGEDYEIISFSAEMARIAAFACILGGGALALLWIQGFILLEQLVEFQVNSLSAAVSIGVSSGITFGGLLWMIVSFLSITIHTMLQKMQEYGVVDDDWDLN